jgi:hypothetical protein
MILWNVVTYLPDFMASHFRKAYSSRSYSCPPPLSCAWFNSKPSRSMEEQRYSTMYSSALALGGGQCMVSRSRGPEFHWRRGWVGPRVGLNMDAKRNIPAGNRIPMVKFIVTQYTDWAIPNYSFLFSFVLVWNLVSDIKGGAYTGRPYGSPRRVTGIALLNLTAICEPIV